MQIIQKAIIIMLNMGRKNTQRSSLRHERSFYPEFGARHIATDCDTLAFFFDDMKHALRNILPSVAVFDERTGEPKFDSFGEPRTKDLFRLYDHVDKTGISVLERRLASDYAKKHRIRWTKQDVGRIRGRIQDEIGRLDLADRNLTINFSNVVRVGDADAEGENARKLALIPDQATDEAEFLVREHAICVDGISTSLSRFRYPYSTYIPHMTLGRIFRDVPKESMNEVVESVQELLPIEVELNPIKFTLQQEI